MSSYQHHIEIFHRSLKNNHFTVNLLYYYLSTLVGVAFFERHDSKSWVIILRLRISKSHTMCHVMSQYTMGHDGSHTHTQWAPNSDRLRRLLPIGATTLTFPRSDPQMPLNPWFITHPLWGYTSTDKWQQKPGGRPKGSQPPTVRASESLWPVTLPSKLEGPDGSKWRLTQTKTTQI